MAREDRELVSIEGLVEFRKALRQLDKEAAKGLRVALNEGAELVLGRARPLVPSRSGRARASMKVRSSQTAVRVAVGGQKAPYYPWLDFGGKVGRNDSTARRFYSDGRYLYPSLREVRAEISDVLARSLTDVARRAGLDVD